MFTLAALSNLRLPIRSFGEVSSGKTSDGINEFLTRCRRLEPHLPANGAIGYRAPPAREQAHSPVKGDRLQLALYTAACQLAAPNCAGAITSGSGDGCWDAPNQLVIFDADDPALSPSPKESRGWRVVADPGDGMKIYRNGRLMKMSPQRPGPRGSAAAILLPRTRSRDGSFAERCALHGQSIPADRSGDWNGNRTIVVHVLCVDGARRQTRRNVSRDQTFAVYWIITVPSQLSFTRHRASARCARFAMPAESQSAMPFSFESSGCLPLRDRLLQRFRRSRQPVACAS